MTTDQLARRPTSFEEMDAALDRMFSDESYEAGRAFRPRPSDIFITPFGKSGTTWLQQIAHGLRTGGSMDFDEITAMTPWHSVALTVGWDLEAEQIAEPRLFKSHENYYDIPKGGRYIVAVRDPAHVVVSGYRFFEDWMFEPGSFDLESYVLHRWPREKMGERGWYRHFNSWWEQRENPDVLLLCYEDMKADHPAAVRRVARFMGMVDDDPRIEIATRQSTREYMLAHAEQFNDHYMRAVGERLGGLPPNGKAHKVTSGDNGEERYRITTTIRAHLDAIWQDQIVPHWGFADYGELRAAFRGLVTDETSEV